jgi:hypothetical protein
MLVAATPEDSNARLYLRCDYRWQGLQVKRSMGEKLESWRPVVVDRPKIAKMPTGKFVTSPEYRWQSGKQAPGLC